MFDAELMEPALGPGQGGALGTTTPSPNGLVAEIIDDEKAMNWAPGKIRNVGRSTRVFTRFWRVFNHQTFFCMYVRYSEVKNQFAVVLSFIENICQSHIVCQHAYWKGMVTIHQ